MVLSHQLLCNIKDLHFIVFAEEFSGNSRRRFDYVIRILMQTQLDLFKHTNFCRFVGKKLETRAALPGLKIEYSADEGVTWSDVTRNMEVEGKIKLRTRSVCNGYL